MKWNIVTDSSCDLFPTALQGGEVQISSVPFVISVGNRDFVDDETLNTAAMLDAMERCKQASHTSCPSPQGWLEQFEKADFCIAITISSNLSGSMNSAVLAKEMVLERYPEKKIAVLDSHSTGPEIVICVEKICDLIEAGADFEKVVSEAEILLRDTHIVFALSSFDNLIKNGRMSKVAGFLASKLGMWGIGIGSDEGTISIKGKTRGAAKAMAMLLEDMKERGYHGGKVVISHCHNLAFADRLQSKIKELWQDAKISIMPTRGLCSYYAERGGLIVSY
jgi:DegV family protein with EDD domain